MGGIVMKIKNRISIMLAFILILHTMFSFFTLTVYADQKREFGIGDYCYFGNYNNNPILWRCIASREEGLLLITDSVLCYKAFDADLDSENILCLDAQNSQEVRNIYGSNEWSTSTIRKWLNSEGVIDWGEKIPSYGYVTSNPYNDEVGFMSSFSDLEKKHIINVKNKCVVNVCDTPDDGEEAHKYSLDYKIESSIENYEIAYSQYVNDDIFLLNTPEVVEMQKNINDGYAVANVKKTNLSDPDNWFVDELGQAYYWLRDAYADSKFPEGVRCIFPGGHEYYMNAHNGDIGIRPAFVIDKSIVFNYGYGTKNDPYCLNDVEIKSSYRNYNTEDLSSNIQTVNQDTFIGEVSLRIGDYICMGVLDGDPILWRCVDINENGPLMLSDRILRFYSYDAAGTHEIDFDNQRSTYGSNLWSTSSIRYWLNSQEEKWVEQQGISIPNSANVYHEYSPYVNSPGFLTCFSVEEQDLIKETEIISLINELDSHLADKGEKVNNLKRKVTYTEGYNDSFSVTTFDKVFLLNRLEAEVVYDNFEYYLMAKPTVGAVRQSDYKTTAISEGKTWHYWLRDAYGGEIYPYFTMDVTTDGRISSDYAYSAQYGIRPAFYLDLSNTPFEQGMGSKDNPYIVQRHQYKEEIIQEASCECDGEKLITCETCGETYSEVINSNGHKFEKEIFTNIFLTDKRVYSCQYCGYSYTIEGVLKKEVAVIGFVLIIICVIIVFKCLGRKRYRY